MKNLNHLSNRLLLLAQASSELAEISFTQLRIDDIVWNARSEILKRKQEYLINVIFYIFICILFRFRNQQHMQRYQELKRIINHAIQKNYFGI